MAVFVRACVCVCVAAEAQPSLCALDKSITKVSAAELAEMASLYRISGQGHTDSVRGPFNTTQTPTPRAYWPESGLVGVTVCF